MKIKNKLVKNVPGSSYLYVVAHITLVIFIVGILGVLLINVRSIGNSLKEQLPIELFFKESVSDEEAKIFVDSIQSSRYIKTLKYIDKNQAAETAKKKLNISNEDLFEARIFPASLRLTIYSEYVQPNILSNIIKKLKKNTLVDEIKYPKDLLRDIHNNFEFWSFWIIYLFFLFLTISIVLINNTLQINIYSSRFAIKIMQLVGAKRGLIYRTFLVKSLWLGFLGSFMAVISLITINYYFCIQQQYVELFYQKDSYLLTMLAIFLTGVGIFISLISTYFAVRKFLNLKLHQLNYV